MRPHRARRRTVARAGVQWAAVAGRSTESLERMEISGWASLAVIFGIILLANVVFHFAAEGLFLATGATILRVLSAGHIRAGEARNLFGRSEKVNGGALFYVENAQHFMYRNFVVMIGLAFWLMVLGAVFGYGTYVHAP